MVDPIARNPSKDTASLEDRADDAASFEELARELRQLTAETKQTPAEDLLREARDER